MPSIKAARNKRRKAAKKAKRAEAKKILDLQVSNKQPHRMNLEYYDIWSNEEKFSIFYDSTLYVAWVKFEAFDWLPLKNPSVALELIKNGEIGGTLTKKPVRKTNIMKKYTSFLNQVNRNWYLSEGSRYKLRMRGTLAIFPQIVSWLRRLDYNEYPGIFQADTSIRDVKEFNEENFDFVKSLIPGFNTGDVSDRWYHVPTEWEEVKKRIYGTQACTLIHTPTPVNRLNLENVLEQICDAKEYYSRVTEEHLRLKYLSRNIDSSKDLLNEALWHISRMNKNDAEVFQIIYDEENTRYLEDLNQANEHFNLVSKAIFQTDDPIENQSVNNLILNVPGNDKDEAILRSMRIPEDYELDLFIDILRKEFIKLASQKKYNQQINNKIPLENVILTEEEMEANSSNISDSGFQERFGCPPMISEAARIDIILEGLSESDRFGYFVNEYKNRSNEMKCMDDLIKNLNVLNSL